MNLDNTIINPNTDGTKNAIIQRASVTYGNKLDSNPLGKSDFSKELNSKTDTSKQEDNSSEIKNNFTETKTISKESETTKKEENFEDINQNLQTDKIIKDSVQGTSPEELLSQNINELLNTKNMLNNLPEGISLNNGIFNIEASIDYSTIKMTTGDAKFFSDLVKNSDKTMQGIVKELQVQMAKNTKEIQSTSNISKTLLNMIKEGIKTNQPFRIDFGKDVAIILQIDKNGVVSANFLPGNAAVEQYLRNNIDYLKQTFDSENLPYNKLTYGEHKQDRNKREDKESS